MRLRPTAPSTRVSQLEHQATIGHLAEHTGQLAERTLQQLATHVNAASFGDPTHAADGYHGYVGYRPAGLAILDQLEGLAPVSGWK